MKVPIVVYTPQEWGELCRGLAQSGKSQGFVPTMGALHDGHASLLRRAVQENDVATLSIFVNATQFNDPADLAKYPQTLARDLELAAELGVHAVFVPKHEDMYPDQYRYRVEEGELSRLLCGAGRPGHFTGVLSVVLKLLVLSSATRAYFGEKDFQQYLLVKEMLRAFFLPVQIIACATLREADGLALSSRNARLSAEGRKQAAHLYRHLSTQRDRALALAALEKAGFLVEYLSDMEDIPGGPRRFVAAFLEGIRLIDNIPIAEIGEAHL